MANWQLPFLPKKIPVVIVLQEAAEIKDQPMRVAAVSETFEKYGMPIKQIAEKSLSMIAVDINKVDLKTLAALPEIKEIWYDIKIFQQLDSINQVTNLRRLREQHNIPESDQTVFVLDVAVNDQHPSLNVIGKHNVTEDQDWIDTKIEHHASHVSGIIGSNHPTYTGIAPGTKIYSVKILNHEGSGSMSNIITGIDHVISQGGKIINGSIGGMNPFCYGNCPVCQAVKNAAAQGIIQIYAAGNSYLPYTLCCPGKSPAALTVAAVDDNGNIANFTSKSGLGQVLKPDFAFMGVDVHSCSGDLKFMNMSGTSMSTPGVSGLVVIILIKKPNLKPDQVKEILKKSCNNGIPYITGAGIINPAKIFPQLV